MFLYLRSYSNTVFLNALANYFEKKLAADDLNEDEICSQMESVDSIG